MECLRGVLEMPWRHLGASWGHLGHVLGKMSKKGRGESIFGRIFERQKSLNFALKMQLAFAGVFKHIFCDFSYF